MHFVATMWIMGILFLAVAVAGQTIKIMGNELPALTSWSTRIALGSIGVVTLVLGSVVYFGDSVRRVDAPFAPPRTIVNAPETTHVSPKTPSGFGVPPDGANPVASWHLDEGVGPTASDASGNANDGTLAGSQVPTWIDGVRGGAGLRFAGDSYVQVPRSPSLEPRFISVQEWVRSGISPGLSIYLLSKGSNECTGASYAFYTGINGGLQFYVSANGRYSIISPDAGARIWDGKWHRIVGTYDESVVRLYVDGKEIGTGTEATFPIGYNLSTGRELYIGAYRGTCVASFSGDIDEITIWDRPLSSYEIANEQ